jgi:hypothetical protein
MRETLICISLKGNVQLQVSPIAHYFRNSGDGFVPMAISLLHIIKLGNLRIPGLTRNIS